MVGRRTPNLPAVPSLAPDVVERVIRRAIELDGDPPVDDHGISEVALVAAAEEVGIEPAAVRAALALEALGPAPERSSLDAIVGSRAVVVEHELGHPADEVRAAVETWLARGHKLRRQWRRGATSEWHRRSDVAASVDRALRSIAGGAELGKVRSLQVSVVELGPDRSHLRLAVDRSIERSIAAGAVGVIGTASIAGGVIAGIAVPSLVVALVGLPVAAATVAITAATRRHADQDLRRRLERLVGQVESGGRPGFAGPRLRRGR